jgi:hypothetical protein
MVVFIVVGIMLFLRAAEDIFANIRTADCRWSAKAEVWLDADHDGQRAASEQPMPNVTVRADDVRNNIIEVASGVTDALGAAELDVFVAGCPETDFEVYVVPPPQFCATTPERLSQPPFTFGVAACES